MIGSSIFFFNAEIDTFYVFGLFASFVVGTGVAQE